MFKQQSLMMVQNYRDSGILVSTLKEKKITNSCGAKNSMLPKETPLK